MEGPEVPSAATTTTTTTATVTAVPTDEISLEEDMVFARRCMDLFFGNKFEEGKQLVEGRRFTHMYHSLAYGCIHFVQAFMTMNHEDIAQGISALKSCIEVASKFRKKESVTEAMAHMVTGKDFPSYTEEERHAELCYADAHLFKALLTVLEDETMSSFVKGGMQLRHGYYAYRNCWNIMKCDPEWRSPALKREFESGILLGVGGFHYLLSMLPPKILKVLEWIGMDGNRERALSQLNRSYDGGDTIRGMMSGFWLLLHHLCFSFFFGFGDSDMNQAKSIVSLMSTKYPEGALPLYMSGRAELVAGNIELAIKLFKKSISVQEVWVQLHHLCYYELMWSQMFLEDWDSAAENALRLLNESKWSRCVYAYNRVACLLMKKDMTTDETDEVRDLMKNMPKWKQRIAGRSIPMEKFILGKAERFFSQGCQLVLPTFELLVVWNRLGYLAARRDILDRMYTKILATIDNLEKGTLVLDEDGKADGLALCRLLAGCCLRYMQLPHLAEEHLTDATTSKVVGDKYIVPWATTELGCVFMDQGNLQEARSTLEKARSKYAEYILDARLSTRIQVALGQLNELESKSKEKM